MTTPWHYGDGAESCRFCGGRGVTEMPPEERPVGMITPATVPCRCVLKRDRLQNMERAWPGLSKAKCADKDATDLEGYSKRNLWITTTFDQFRSHLHRLALLSPSSWFFRVVSDADIVTAWLGSVAFKGSEVFDPDAKESTKFITVVDLVGPPDLLVIYLGVKTARNAATPEVVLEALQQRLHLGKPTWVVDQLNDHRFQPGHRAYSSAMAEILSSWKRKNLTAASTTDIPVLPSGVQAVEVSPPVPSPVVSEEIQTIPITMLDRIQNQKPIRPKKGKERPFR